MKETVQQAAALTFTDVLKACGNGEMPKVKRLTPLKYSPTEFGVVTAIKKGDGCACGIAVRFEGMEWDTWYHSEGSDKRSKYISELALLK